ncbi:hypothetical protein N7509_013877 [Penicillium cosmopolitanum]|uniref:Transmembrane protein n=1 Tax=Penicillium cosmopolitanum TaxID=1131564 RepID=A0A9W9VF15_9EURO|nr:uncharacterized protein N7509_013877 [Penicillium cosmopolitanum]KAJ5376991.1 hypothetical protein N7509_013877 [Penicillium cosmopolitanum]
MAAPANPLSGLSGLVGLSGLTTTSTTNPGSGEGASGDSHSSTSATTTLTHDPETNSTTTTVTTTADVFHNYQWKTEVMVVAIALILLVFVFLAWWISLNSADKRRLAAINNPEGARALRQADAADAAANPRKGWLPSACRRFWVWVWVGEESSVPTATLQALEDLNISGTAAVCAVRAAREARANAGPADAAAALDHAVKTMEDHKARVAEMLRGLRK